MKVLTSALLISPPAYDQGYILYISASTFSVTGVLVQEGDDRKNHTTYYIRKQLFGLALNYSHDEKLALIAVHYVQNLCHYILLHKTKL